MTRLAVVTAGLSTPSTSRMLADRMAAATVRLLDDTVMTPQAGADAAATTVDTVELRELAQDITSHLLTGFASPRLADTIATVVSADGVVVVTPIFSGSYSGLFKSFFDVIEPTALAGTPAFLGATGGSARHSLVIDYAVRPLLTYLHAQPVSTGIFAAAEDWGGTEDATPLTTRIERGAQEFAAAIRAAGPRAQSDPYSPDTYLGVNGSFDRLLGERRDP